MSLTNEGWRCNICRNVSHWSGHNIIHCLHTIDVCKFCSQTKRGKDIISWGKMCMMCDKKVENISWDLCTACCQRLEERRTPEYRNNPDNYLTLEQFAAELGIEDE